MSAGCEDVLPKCFVIVFNISKRHNVGTLLRSAAAFGVAEVCLVGTRKFNTFGSHGASDYLQYKHFATLEEACTYLVSEQGCTIVGLEITEGAQGVQKHPFTGSTAFMLGNEGTGLSPKQAALCHSFVYIPQHGDGTASLNVTVAASIVLHHFALWARYPERERVGQKFVVDSRPVRTAPRGVVPLTAAELELEKERRRQRRQCASGSGSDGDGCNVLHWDTEEGNQELQQCHGDSSPVPK